MESEEKTEDPFWGPSVFFFAKTEIIISGIVFLFQNHV